MGSDLNVYVGKYLKVWLPTEKEEEYNWRCKVCGTYGSKNCFCEECGAKLEPVLTDCMIDHYDFCEEVFCGEDKFLGVIDDDNDYVFVMPNCKAQKGGVFIDNLDTEAPLPNDKLTGDWIVLMDAYDERGIKYEKKEGILQWWD